MRILSGIASLVLFVWMLSLVHLTNGRELVLRFGAGGWNDLNTYSSYWLLLPLLFGLYLCITGEIDYWKQK